MNRTLVHQQSCIQRYKIYTFIQHGRVFHFLSPVLFSSFHSSLFRNVLYTKETSSNRNILLPSVNLVWYVFFVATFNVKEMNPFLLPNCRKTDLSRVVPRFCLDQSSAGGEIYLVCVFTVVMGISATPTVLQHLGPPFQVPSSHTMHNDEIQLNMTMSTSFNN